MRMIDADALIKKAHQEAEAMAKPYEDFGVLVEWLVDKTPTIEPEPHWIPVSERLPEEEYVIISKKPTKLSGSKWCVTMAIRTADPRSGKIHWRDIGFGVIPDDDVLAWMPLPSAYREEGD